MSKGRILVVEDEIDISNMLRIYFTGQGYDVQVAGKGGEALEATRRQLPNLIVLDINLPDMSGYDVCRDLRTTTRTSHIPIIFLTQKDERSDKIAGLELGADDYITKPFDIEELKLRVQNAILASDRSKQINPVSGFPTGRLIEDHLRGLMGNDRDWTYVDLKLNNFDMFAEVYGWAAGDEVIRFLAQVLIVEEIDKHGTPDDYIGHPGRDNFVIISHSDDVERLVSSIIDRFAHEARQHYTFIDRERGYMLVEGASGQQRADLMSLNAGMVSTHTHRFSDIREVTELAAENRRRSTVQDSGISDDADANILTSW